MLKTLKKKLQKFNENIGKVKDLSIPSIFISTEGIPSKGIGYPKDIEISYVPFTFGEIKYYSQSKLSIEDKYNFILGGITVKNYDKIKLTFNDFIYLGLLRNLSTFESKKLDIKFACKSCFKDNSIIYNCKDLDFEELTIPEFPINVKLSFGEYKFFPLTVEDMIKASKDGVIEDSSRMFLRQCKDDSIYKHLEKVNPEDVFFLKEVDKLLYHGVKPVNVECKSCKHKQEISIGGGDGDVFVSPFRKYRGSDKDRIYFGNKKHSFGF